MRSEADYQRELVKRIKQQFPGCVIIKPDPAETQGFPDLLILWGGRWGMLEVKVSETAPLQPNQTHYINRFGKMSFAAFIWPENEEQVLYDMQTALGVYH